MVSVSCQQSFDFLIPQLIANLDSVLIPNIPVSHAYQHGRETKMKIWRWCIDRLFRNTVPKMTLYWRPLSMRRRGTVHVEWWR